VADCGTNSHDGVVQANSDRQLDKNKCKQTDRDKLFLGGEEGNGERKKKLTTMKW